VNAENFSFPTKSLVLNLILGYITSLGKRRDSITGCFAKRQQSETMVDYEGHLEYSEITDWPHIFDANYNPPWYSYMKDQVGTIYRLYSLKFPGSPAAQPLATWQ
jgi:hypothetical protein